MTVENVPQGVGYWGDGEGATSLPRPQTLVCPGWQPADRGRIVAYLKGGHIFGQYCGLARCRFAGCGKLLGSCDLTDGVWVWPQGLEHYLEDHEVCLLPAFVETMQANGWQVSAAARDADMARCHEEWVGQFRNLSHWIAWAKELTEQRPA